MKQQESSFYTHYSPWGSYSSFMLGKYYHGGGFVLSNVQVPDMNVYLGYRQGEQAVRMFPFYTDKRIGIGAENYHRELKFEDSAWREKNVDQFSPEEIHRRTDWCSETWSAGILSFTFYTPFEYIKPLEEMDFDENRRYTAPLIIAALEVDNSESHLPATALFGVQGMRRMLSEATGRVISGVAGGTECGFACATDDDVQELLCWDIIETGFHEGKNHLLGNEGGLAFTVPAGKKKSYTLVLGTYQGGIITSNILAKLYYTNFFSGLEDVLEYGIEAHESFIQTALERNRVLNNSRLNSSRRFLLAHATRGYLANTELLVDNKGNPIFVVNEGEYQMMNTLDLIVDQTFWELLYTPWTIKNELNFFKDNYYYHDSVKTSEGIRPGGVSFSHDQGVANMFSPMHTSVYEISDQNHTFSFMTYEELLNWILTAALYVFVTKDTEWLKENKSLVEDVFVSLKNRDNDQDGIMDSDSYKCRDGSEISTYDSLDQSLSQARNNLYLAVKGWAAWLCIGKLFSSLKMSETARKAETKAEQAAATIVDNFNSEEGFIPAIFENCKQSKIIPAIEGLIYPYIIGDYDAVSEEGRFSELIRVLKTHITNVLVPAICIDEQSGGWKLSSTSENTWMSKIFLNQYVCEKILGIMPAEDDNWDAVHESWQREACSTTGATDQVSSRTGEPIGSRLYPRLVTALLWLEYDR
ncbi:MAG: glycoside hydrolase family 52 protein [Spirochaetaceae bacterium]|nr:glycoside hydrolase family 52 protein [Spirochaetaceae bacterium]MCF7948404.1 glycoside hydrolase family 52 protein [Spirochaetia bacterium]MCF7950853.1 glycoside hydrolase family 52 protein [Spirochaetaceae bacterium]